MSTTLDATTKMAVEECCNCGMIFAMPVSFKNDRLERRKNDMTFYCPRGHAQHYTGKSREQKLREELDAERRRRESAEQNIAFEQDQRRSAERSAAAYKGQATRLRTRAKAGICPCCNRHFVQLERHMASQHPGFTADAEQGPQGN